MLTSLVDARARNAQIVEILFILHTPHSSMFKIRPNRVKNQFVSGKPWLCTRSDVTKCIGRELIVSTFTAAFQARVHEVRWADRETI
jgi:hypothetical protein